MTKERGQELQDLKKRIGINSSVWDALVAKTRDDIAKELNGYDAKPIREKYKVEVLDTEGNLLHTFDTPSECAKYYGIESCVIYSYIARGHPYKKLGISFRKLPKEKE